MRFLALFNCAMKDRDTVNGEGALMISALIGVLIIVVIGAICFWAIDKFARDRRLAQLLKLLVVLICLAAILQRVLPLLGIYSL
jgi:NhaP-type Na+/H+ or K+/H+ antiporter